MCHQPRIVVVSILLAFAAAQAAICLAAEEAGAAKAREPELAAAIETRFKSDQVARFKIVDFYKVHQIRDEKVDVAALEPTAVAEYEAFVKAIEDEDSKNRQWLKEVVRKHGWPGKSLVGANAAHQVWLLVQHADKVREFQRECLKKMEALPKGEVRPANIAYLEDRVLRGTGKKQKYGTQLELTGGKFVPQPIEDEEHVDERRKAVGLEPLAEYLKMNERLAGLAK